MHLQLQLEGPCGLRIPAAHLDLLTNAVYDVLAASDQNFAQFLRQNGYPLIEDAMEGSPPKRYKLFVFGNLRGTYRVDEGQFVFESGRVWWRVSTGTQAFHQHFLNGLELLGHELPLAQYRLHVARVEEMPEVSIVKDTARFLCLTPIVIRCREGNGYLLPEDPEYGEAVQQNLINKYTAAYGDLPKDRSLTIEFDQAYMARKNVVRSTTFRSIRHIGVTAPFILSGSPKLIEAAYDFGIGERNGSGFGMIVPA